MLQFLRNVEKLKNRTAMPILFSWLSLINLLFWRFQLRFDVCIFPHILKTHLYKPTFDTFIHYTDFLNLTLSVCYLQLEDFALVSVLRVQSSFQGELQLSAKQLHRSSNPIIKFQLQSAINNFLISGVRTGILCQQNTSGEYINPQYFQVKTNAKDLSSHIVVCLKMSEMSTAYILSYYP